MTNVHDLLDRDVIIPCPTAVEVGTEVDPNQIAPGVVIHPGCRIAGSRTSIGMGCELGEEGPVTIDNCAIGNRVQLKGGYFSGAVLLDDSNMGSGAHVRGGTLIEEEAGGAHAVGFKQTILLSYVTAGSLINFCDALMAGGTSRKDHSEIGSSYVHFNFTPHGDKATASLVGDVPRGVMLDRPRIFLGGQGGLVGPVRIEYGCVIAAGVICRKDCPDPDMLILGDGAPGGAPRPYTRDVYEKIEHKILNNLLYIGNLRALQAWYRHARPLTMDGDPFAKACRQAALALLDEAVAERVKRIDSVAEKIPHSMKVMQISGNAAALAEQQAFVKRWHVSKAALAKAPAESVGAKERDAFLAEWKKAAAGRKHTEAVAALSAPAKKAGTAWLQAIVDAVADI